MKRIVKIKGVGTVVFPDSMSNAEVSQAAGGLYDAKPARKGSTGVAGNTEQDQDTSGWRHIQTSDQKHYMIHPEDLEEARRRDPNLKVLE